MALRPKRANPGDWKPFPPSAGEKSGDESLRNVEALSPQQVSLTPLTYKAVIIRELTFSMTGPPPLENQYILVFYWMVFPVLRMT